MKPRPFSGSWPNFLCRLVVVVILLQGISAQPVWNERGLSSPPEDRRPPSTLLERWPPLPRGPQPSPSQPIRLEKIPEKSKTPHPILLPFSVPVPWPTPFNGTDFAPLPTPIRPQKTIRADLPSDSNSLLILVPEFEFIPLYYNSPVVHTTCESLCPAKVIPREKPTPKPSSQPKPWPQSQPKPISKPRPKPSPALRSDAAQTPTKCPPVKPIGPLSPQPRPKPTENSKKKLPSKHQPKPSDRVFEHHPTFRGFAPPPKHTWTPPPENVPEYIPPTPSHLHTRSSESDHENDDDYDPRYYALSDNRFYSPETYTNTRYDPYRNEAYNQYDPAYYDETAYITYGPDSVTFTESTADEDGFVTYGPDTITYTDDPVWAYPKRPFSHTQQLPSRQPTYVTYESDYEPFTEPEQYEGDYIAAGPHTVTFPDNVPVPSPAKPKRPSTQSLSSGLPAYVTYDQETETTTDPATYDDEYIIYGSNVDTSPDDFSEPLSPKQSNPAKLSPTSFIQPLPDQTPFITRHTYYGPRILYVTEPTTRGDGYVTYVPSGSTEGEDALVSKGSTPKKPPRPSSRPPPPDKPSYATYGPDKIVITEPATPEEGYVIHESNVETHTEDAPVPERPIPAKSPRPSSRPPLPDQPSYFTHEIDQADITKPTAREKGYDIHESGVETRTEYAPVPKRPTPAKEPRPSSRLPLPDQPSYTYGPDKVPITKPTARKDDFVIHESGVETRTEYAPVPNRPTPTKKPQPSPRPSPPTQPSYATHGPDKVVLTEPTTRADGYSYVIPKSGVETRTGNAPIPPKQQINTYGMSQRSWKQPPVSQIPQEATKISGGSSALPAPKEPQGKEVGNVYYGPTSYTVYEEPSGDRAVTYQSGIFEAHEDVPHLETTAEDPNVQYYELEPEYETYYDEEPQYYTTYENENDQQS